MSQPKIALVIGSTRQGRFADLPAGWLTKLGQARADLSLQVLDLRDHALPMFDEPGPPAAVPPANEAARRWGQALAGADGFIFLTPEYNHGIPAVLKNALDYAFHEWGRKPAAFVGYGALGAARAVQTLRLTAGALGMACVPKALHIGMAEFQGLRGGRSFEEFPHLDAAAKTMFDDLLWWARTLAAGRAAA